MKRALKDFEKELLKAGNCYLFAQLYLEFYPKEAEKMGIDINKIQNCYKSIFSFDDGIFTLWGDDGVKYFFDAEMNFRGSKN